jgi:hypothetical protein
MNTAHETLDTPAAPAADHKPGIYFHPPPEGASINTRRGRVWLWQCLGWFAAKYKDKQAEKYALDVIQKHFPGFTPTLRDFRCAYWGTPPPHTRAIKHSKLMAMDIHDARQLAESRKVIPGALSNEAKRSAILLALDEAYMVDHDESGAE